MSTVKTLSAEATPFTAGRGRAFTITDTSTRGAHQQAWPGIIRQRSHPRHRCWHALLSTESGGPPFAPDPASEPEISAYRRKVILHDRSAAGVQNAPTRKQHFIFNNQINPSMRDNSKKDKKRP
ncbi:hypothetical protein K5D34_23040 [Pseudomonas cichorii]|nr:hypothetical protein [Pseudomonas cichorii]MBX8512565.1 hypothetical protein [Pseudomonas cichorii]MBX8525390.1 hypothetical protein [Pseudomonas cichorii]